MVGSHEGGYHFRLASDVNDRSMSSDLVNKTCHLSKVTKRDTYIFTILKLHVTNVTLVKKYRLTAERTLDPTEIRVRLHKHADY